MHPQLFLLNDTRRHELTETQGKQVPYLPEVIIEEILKRLPVKSLVRFSCTCKRWRYLIFCDSKFNKVHIDHAKRPLWKIPEMCSFALEEEEDYELLRRTIDCDCNIAACPIPTFTSYIRNPMAVLGSCNGLLLFAGTSVSNRDKQEFVLWNPYTNSTKRIDGFKGQTGGFRGDKYLMSGLTYDCASDDYKAVVVLDEFMGRPTYVFSLRRSSWKKLSEEDLTIVDRTIKCRYHSEIGIILNNVICYWEINLDGENLSSVICFDPVVEKFKEVPLPDKLRSPTDYPLGIGDYPLGIGALDGCLSIIRKKGVWVMKEYGCWTKLHVVRSTKGFQPLGYNSSKDQVLMLKVGIGTSCFRILDVKKGAVSKSSNIQVRSIGYADKIVLYTESLMCPWLGLQ